ncbi:MAG: sulfurtransferase [Actinomycetota bacterium]
MGANLAENWIVSANSAKQLLEQGATFLDARELILKVCGTLEGAIPVTWEDFSCSDAPNQGKLLENDLILTQKLQAVGIFKEQPVVVFADPIKGWGEDGRIVWMLRTLGHPNAVLVDGGYQALGKAGIPTVLTGKKTPPVGNFVVSRVATWEIQRDELKANLGRENVVFIDTREPREYAGETPYGEQRGGHIPGAVHLYYKELIDQEGKLLTDEEIFAHLQQKGITQTSEIVNYCTGGVRAGWLTSVLTQLGFHAKNYAGSMWEWSAAPSSDYPLEI